MAQIITSLFCISERQLTHAHGRSQTLDKQLHGSEVGPLHVGDI